MRLGSRFLTPCVVACLTATNFAFSDTSGISSEFHFSGFLQIGTKAANGTYDFEFALYSVPTGGAPVGDASGSPAVIVKKGAYAAKLDFGPASFAGAPAWVEVRYRSSKQGGSYITSPLRTQILPAPYAMKSARAGHAETADAVTTSVNSGHADTADYATNAGHAVSADSATNATSAVTATNSQFAVQATTAVSAEYATTATVALSALTAEFATTASAAAALGEYAAGDFTPFKWQAITTHTQAVPNRGYLANSLSQLNITLPESPAVGDVIRVSGLGAGGWKLSQNAGQFIRTFSLGIIGTVYPASWVPREDPRNWTALAVSYDGETIVGANGGGWLYVSHDGGQAWAQRGFNASWSGVACSSDGNRMVACASNSYLFTSDNGGGTWTPRDFMRAWSAVASSADGQRLAAATQLGQIYISTDFGVSWEPRDSSRDWFSLACSADGMKLIASVQNSDIYLSTDGGNTWLPEGMSGVPWKKVASSADGQTLAATAGIGQIHVSKDGGASWTPRESNRIWGPVAVNADGNRIVACEQSGLIYVSADSGVSWTTHEAPQNWACAAASGDGSLMAAAFTGGQIYTAEPPAIAQTTAGQAGSLTGSADSAIELQYIGGNGFKPISYVQPLGGQ